MVGYITSLDVNNLEYARLIRSLLISSMNADHLTAGLAEILLLCLLDGKGKQVVRALVRWDLEADHATSAVKLTDN